MALVENTEIHDEWDWDTFKKDPELELWVIRVPNGVSKFFSSGRVEGVTNCVINSSQSVPTFIFTSG